MPLAAIVLATAKLRLIPAAVRINISGSIIGDETQNAMTGARGTPLASIAAINGITPQGQDGDSAPAKDAAKIVITGLPEKARAISPSAPVAFA